MIKKHFLKLTYLNEKAEIINYLRKEIKEM